MSRAQNGDAAPTAEENKMEATSIRVREHDKRGWHVIATFESVEWANGRQWHHQIISEAIQARCSRFRCWFLVGEWWWLQRHNRVGSWSFFSSKGWKVLCLHVQVTSQVQHDTCSEFRPIFSTASNVSSINTIAAVTQHLYRPFSFPALVGASVCNTHQLQLTTASKNEVLVHASPKKEQSILSTTKPKTT